jgi:adenylate cyclase
MGLPHFKQREFLNYTWSDWFRIPKSNKPIIARTILGFLAYALFIKGFNPMALSSSLLIGIPVGYIIALVETHTVEFKMFFRRSSFMTFLMFKTFRLVILLAIIINIVFGLSLAVGFHGGDTIFPSSFQEFYQQHFYQLMIIALLEDMFANFLIELDRKLGKGVLKNLVMGKYHNAEPEERIFLFLDLKHSTSLAEEMGELKFSEFLQDFFYDISDPINDFGGEVYQYVGDEMVVSWKVEKDVTGILPVYAFLAAQEKIEELSEYYLTNYSVMPHFRASIHQGTVICSEVGKIKSEIAYHGDVLNTTARMLELGKASDRDLLISEIVYKTISVSSEIYTESMGEFLLRGKNKPVVVYAVDTLYEEHKEEKSEIPNILIAAE